MEAIDRRPVHIWLSRQCRPRYAGRTAPALRVPATGQHRQAKGYDGPWRRSSATSWRTGPRTRPPRRGPAAIWFAIAACCLLDDRGLLVGLAQRRVQFMVARSVERSAVVRTRSSAGGPPGSRDPGGRGCGRCARAPAWRARVPRGGRSIAPDCSNNSRARSASRRRCRDRHLNGSARIQGE